MIAESFYLKNVVYPLSLWSYQLLTLSLKFLWNPFNLPIALLINLTTPYCSIFTKFPELFNIFGVESC